MRIARQPRRKTLDTQLDDEAGYDCDQEKDRLGEPGIGEEHAEELFANVTDDAH